MPGKVRLLLPSLDDIFFLCPFVTLSLNSGINLLNDFGTGVHIRAGEYIISHFKVPRHDIFSYTSPPLRWITHEWLSEVIMAAIHHMAGLTGVVVFFSFVIAFTYALLFRLLRANTGNVILSCLLVILVAASSMLHWLARPHVFTLALTVIWYYILDAYQYRNKNYFYVLPLIMLLWVNLHGGFIIGFFLLGIYAVGNAAGALFFAPTEKKACKDKFHALTYAGLVCIVVSLANPHGFHALFFPFNTVSQQFLIDTVMEYLSPNFHDPLPFKYLLLLTIGILAASQAKVNLVELLLVLLFTYMALYSARHIPLFAIVVAPILTRHTELMLQRADGKVINLFKSRSNRIARIDAQLKAHLWPIVAVVVVAVFVKAGFVQFSFEQTSAPVAAVNFLKRESLSGHMFNSDRFGDFIVYAAWPQYRVFIDGRSDMYGSERAREYLKVIMIQPGWKEVLKKYDINFVFFSANSPLSLMLAETDDWRLVYADKIADVFVRNVPENRAVIDKYPDVKLVLDNDSTKG